jgi:hypothetical protein
MDTGTHPTYRQTLAAIGRYLDQHSYDDLILCELGDGYVGRVMQAGRLVEAIPFQAADLAGMIRADAEEAAQPGSREVLAPNPRGSFVRQTVGSYHDFLAALGRQCDMLEAKSLVIAELPAAVLVVFGRQVGQSGSGEATRCEYMYDADGMRRLMLGSASALRS